jgi:hypothetical protein
MPGLDSVTASMFTEVRWAVAKNQTGSNYNPIQSSSDIRKTYNFGTTAANNATGGGDEVFSFQQGIVAAGSATIDLSAMTNQIGQTGVSIARIKALQIRLLAGADDPTLSPTPTATSTITLTNIGPATPSPLDFGNGGSGLAVNTTVSAGVLNTVAVNNAGTNYPKSTFFPVLPNQAGGSGGILSAGTNNTGGVNAVAITAGGAGYTNATALGTTVAGSYNVYTGGVHVYFDPSAVGFVLVDATHKNITVLNMDAANAVTFELDIFAATS